MPRSVDEWMEWLDRHPMSAAQEAELIAHLLAEKAAAADALEDTRRPIAEILADALVEAAGRSSDPIAFGSLARAFDERRRFHLSGLLAAVPASDDVGTWVGEFSRAWHEAERRTVADGFADPALTLMAPVAVVAEAPPSVLDVERLPAVARRARPSAAHDADPAPRRPPPVIDAAPVHDPLGPFRGRPDYDGPIFPDN